MDLAKTLEGLAELEETTRASGLAAIAKLMRGGDLGTAAKATPKDRCKFSLDTLPWDLLDLEVEKAEERGGTFGAEDV